jgi:prephenate dehydratase
VQGSNKASICFQVGNAVGCLAKVLNIFADEGINLSKIQSMPVLGKRNEYNFYIDIEWKDLKSYDNAIRKVLKYTVNFNIMGEYVKNDEVKKRPAPIK